MKIQLISTWEELGKLENNKYYIDMDKCGGCGWIRPKFEVSDDDYYDHNGHLSTHTFYGNSYNNSTAKLRRFGFNVQLENWDGETIYL